MSAPHLAPRKKLKKQTIVSLATMTASVLATGDRTSGGTIAMSNSYLPLVPRAAVEKSMLQHDLWPLVSEFANLASRFNDEMN